MCLGKRLGPFSSIPVSGFPQHAQCTRKNKTQKSRPELSKPKHVLQKPPEKQISRSEGAPPTHLKDSSVATALESLLGPEAGGGNNGQLLCQSWGSPAGKVVAGGCQAWPWGGVSWDGRPFSQPHQRACLAQGRQAALAATSWGLSQAGGEAVGPSVAWGWGQLAGRGGPSMEIKQTPDQIPPAGLQGRGPELVFPERRGTVQTASG